MGSEPIRVLVGKPGLDGHDRGARMIARVLRDDGFEVVYPGLHQTIDALVAAARDEDVDVVGLSVLSGSHLAYTREMRQRLDALDLRDVPIVVGGILPAEDEPALRSAGAEDVFPVGTNVLEIGERLRRLLRDRRDG